MRELTRRAPENLGGRERRGADRDTRGLLTVGETPEAVGHETAMARAQLPPDKELAPIVHIDDPQMAETADQVLTHGADGIAFFLFKEEWKRMTAPAFG